MHSLETAHRMLNTELTVAAGVVDQWIAALRVITAPPANRVVLPMNDLAGRFLDIEPAFQVLPEKLQRLPEDSMRTSLEKRMVRVALHTGCLPPKLTRGLSDLAADVASYRVLLDPMDTFDVTEVGVLTAVALINGLHFLNQWKKYSKLPAAKLKRVTRNVWRPLQLCDSVGRDLRPGDLWISDLAARTMREAVRILSQDYQRKPVVQTLGGLMLEFVTRSLLNKLLEAESLGKRFVPFAKYELWHGIEAVMHTGDGASLRNVLSTELIREVVTTPDGYSAIGLLKLIGRLTQEEGNRLWQGRLLVAQILWELLECDPKILKKLLAKGPVARTILDGVRYLRNWNVDTPVEGDELYRNRLRDVMVCLNCYQEFLALMRLVDAGRSVTPLPVSPGVPTQ